MEKFTDAGMNANALRQSAKQLSSRSVYQIVYLEKVNG